MSDRHTLPRLFSIAPHGQFLPHLVAGILEGPVLGDWPKTNPFWLADVTIVLPTQRARLALSSAFAHALGGGALLPDIRTLGGDEGEAKHFIDTDLTAPLPKAISPLDRQFLLSELIERWVQVNGHESALDEQELLNHPARLLSLANALGDLIDEFENEEISAEAIRSVPEFGFDASRQEDLAKNFAKNLKFLEIVLSNWPKILASRKLVNASGLNNLRVARQIKTLHETYTDRPVIVAGSTGSVPATAKLLKAITQLQRGCLVLPGLNTQMSKKTFEDLLDPKNMPHGHPQYGLAQLLNRLGQVPNNVCELSSAPKNKRNEIVSHALSLAADTGNWVTKRAEIKPADITNSTKDIGIIAAKNEREQALAIALAARQAIADNNSVGIITPDRNFARRIAVELKRFKIEADDSAGIPLFQSQSGRLVRQILDAQFSGFGAVELMALFQNRHVQVVGEPLQNTTCLSNLEFALLRGQRPAPGIEGLRRMLAKNLEGKLDHPALRLNKEQAAPIGRLLDWLDAAFTPLSELMAHDKFSSGKLADALKQVLFRLCPAAQKDNAELQGANQFVQFANDLARSKQAGPAIGSKDALDVLRTLMAGISVRNRLSPHPKISIWGQLEARMLSADLMILATLNEGVWPQIADPGPWLSRGMRLNAGLEPPERQHGLAAHDFEMAIGHEHVLLTYGSRLGATPASPSRLLLRFCGFVGKQVQDEMEMRGEKWLKIARSLDVVPALTPAKRPEPRPPAHLRPRKISITEVEALIRSPFDLYAKHVLGLRPIGPLGEDISNRERGSLVHKIFAQFVDAKHNPMEADSHDNFMAIARSVFDNLGGQSEQREIWLKRLSKSGGEYLNFERARQNDIAVRFAEQDISWTFDVEGQPFTLYGRADRIDLRQDGRLDILDFKTGGVPTKNDMQNFLAPQLLVEAAIAKNIGFAAQKKAAPHELSYIKIGTDPKGFSLEPFALPTGMDVGSAAEQIMRNIHNHVSVFLLSDNFPMMPRLMPNSSQSYAGPYDHLARAAEWTEIEEGSEE